MRGEKRNKFLKFIRYDLRCIDIFSSSVVSISFRSTYLDAEVPSSPGCHAQQFFAEKCLRVFGMRNPVTAHRDVELPAKSVVNKRAWETRADFGTQREWHWRRWIWRREIRTVMGCSTPASTRTKVISSLRIFGALGSNCGLVAKFSPWAAGVGKYDFMENREDWEMRNIFGEDSQQL